MGLKVKHRTAFARPNSVCQSLLSSSSFPLRCATACTSSALNLTNTEQHNHSKALGGQQIWNATKDICEVLTGFYANDQIRALNLADTGIL